MRYVMCIHNYMFPVIYLGVKILKNLWRWTGWRRADWRVAKGTYALCGRRCRGQNLHIENIMMSCHLTTCSVTIDR